MKKLFFVYIALFLSMNVFGQAPGKMSYQAVIRDGDKLVSNQTIGMRISILQGSADGTEVYQETYDPNPATNANGLVSVEIGAGVPLIGSFSTIDWANGPYFIKTETDPNGGTNYSITGVSQLMSVPYALYAETSGTSGPAGQDGMDGKSAYEIAVDNGFNGTEADWLSSLKGADGQDGAQGPQGISGVDGVDGYAPDGTAVGEMLYWDGNAWVSVEPGGEDFIFVFKNGKPTWKHPDFDVFHNGFGYNEVTNPTTGKTWLDRNLGATQVATSSTDEASYGDLYQWGRGTDGHQLRTSDTTNTLSSSDTPGHGDFIVSSSSPYDWRSPQNDNLWQGVDGINNPCPNGYRIPSLTEWENENKSWSSNNTAGAFNSPLKLPLAGLRSDGSLFYVGIYGYYWSSTENGIYSGNLNFYNSETRMFGIERAYGFSVRCIQN